MTPKDVLTAIADLNNEFVLEPINNTVRNLGIRAIPTALPQWMREEATAPLIENAQGALAQIRQLFPEAPASAPKIKGILTTAQWSGVKNFLVYTDPYENDTVAYHPDAESPAYTTRHGEERGPHNTLTWHRIDEDLFLPDTLHAHEGDNARKALQNPIFAWQHPVTFLSRNNIQWDMQKTEQQINNAKNFLYTGNCDLYDAASQSYPSVKQLIDALADNTLQFRRITTGLRAGKLYFTRISS